MNRLHTPLDIDEWNFASPDYPLQNNGKDCGVFVCIFAEYLSKNCDFNFDHTHITSFRQLIAYENIIFLKTRELHVL